MGAIAQKVNSQGSTPVRKKDEGKSNDPVRSLVASMEPAIKRALPKHMGTERFARIAITAIKTTPKLIRCFDSGHGRMTLLGALMQAAQVGLEPGLLGTCYILPFNTQVNNQWVTEAQFILGYRGMIELTRRSGEVQTIYAHAVHENDTFELSYGVGGTMKHTPALDGDRGEMRGCYAFCELKDGACQYEYMTNAELERIRDEYSKGADSKYSPWNTEFAQMAKKTVIRQLFKTLPTAIEIHRSQVHDESTVKLNDRGELDVEETALDRFAERQAQASETAEADTPPDEIESDVADTGDSQELPEYSDDEIPFDPSEEDENRLPTDMTHYAGWKDQNKRLGQLLRHVSELEDDEVEQVRPAMAHRAGEKALRFVHPDKFEELVDEIHDATHKSGSDGQISPRADLLFGWIADAENAQGELVE